MRGSRAVVPAVFVALAAIYGAGQALAPGPSVQGDGYYTWLWARSLAYAGDLDLTDDYAQCGDPWGLAARGEGSRPPNQWTIGSALLWTPFAVIGRLTHPGDPGCRGPVARFAMVGTIVAALLALWLAYRLTTRYVDRGPALLAVLGVGLASPLTHYTLYLPSYSHVPAAFGTALFLERWDATRGSRGLPRWAGMGALLALAMLLRPQLAILALAPLLEWIGTARDDLRRRDRRALGWLTLAGLVFTAAAVAGFAPQLALNRGMYGSFFDLPQGPHYMRWAHPGVAGTLFGTTGGLLFWTPFLYLSVVGLILAPFRRRTRVLGASLLLVCSITLYVNAAAWDWWGSMGFSNRRFVELSAPFVFGAALVLASVFRWAERRPRRAVAALLTIGVVCFATWNFAAMAGVATGRIDGWREQPADRAWQDVFRELSTAVHERVGNPLAWPASIPFALRYDVHPKHWDVMQGMAIFYVNYEDLAPRIGEKSVHFRKPLHQAYLVEGFEVQRKRRRTHAVTSEPRARMLLPLFMGAVRAVDVRWRADGKDAARAVLTWNDTPVAQVDVRPRRWQRTRIALPAGVARTGVNELVWSVTDGSVAIDRITMVPAEWLPPARRFGERAVTGRRIPAGRSSRGSRK
ncbi:MAG: hypothetical protein ACODAG_02485 [Myxococcota bacterium]